MNGVSTTATPGSAAVRSGPVFVPTLRYGDAARAIDRPVEADDGTIAHAELALARRSFKSRKAPTVVAARTPRAIRKGISGASVRTVSLFE